MNKKQQNITIAIVDDHAILRYGLRKMIEAMPNTEVVIEAADGRQFIEQLKCFTPQLVIMDINMPVMGGEEAIKKARKMVPELKVIVLSMNSEEHFFRVMTDLGVDGFILKESDFDEMERAVKIVMKGGKYFSQELLLGLVNKSVSETDKIILSKRETEVLNCLCNGLSAAESAEKLFVSPRTVEKYRADLFVKTNTKNALSLVIYALKNGLVKL